MRCELSVPFTQKGVNVAQGVITVKAPEIVAIIKSRSMNVSFELAVRVLDWNLIEQPAAFKVSGLAPNGYKVSAQGDLEIHVPEIANLVASVRGQPNFSFEITIADDGWLTPPVTITRS